MIGGTPAGIEVQELPVVSLCTEVEWRKGPRSVPGLVWISIFIIVLW